MQPKDLYGIVSASSPRLSPSGRTVAFVVTRVDEAENTYRSQVWLAAVNGSTPPEPFSNGEHHDGSPRWSPDGRRVAFTSSRPAPGQSEAKSSTLHVRPVVGGGETITLATSPEGISDLEWSPDGRWLAYASRARTDRYDSDDPKKQPPRRITRFFARLNGEGWVVDRPQHIFVVPADGSAAPKDLTPGEHQFASPRWSPDSTRLVIDGASHDTWDLDLANDLFTVGLDGEPPVRLTASDGSLFLGSWSPDGAQIAFVGTDDPLSDPQNARVGILEVATGERRWVSTLDRNHAPYGSALPPVWDGEAVLVLVEDRGDVQIRRVPRSAEGDEPVVVGGERNVTSFDLQGSTVAFVATSATTMPELFALAGGEERQLTNLGDSFVERIGLRPYERFTSPSTGDVEVDTWVVTPPDFDPAGSYPALLTIHGGPFSQFGNRFFDEVQLYARAGYVVVFANPRGSSGRETSWGRAITGSKLRTDPGTGWGSVDYEDVMAVTDEALRRYPAIDAGRLGVLGGSYGGYLTSWIVGHTDRFAAACSERAVNNILTLEATSDIASAFRTQVGVNHLEDPSEYLARSPITFVQRIRTPMLLIHSEDDLRCPIEQAEQLFVALRTLGREVELVRFPAENHELSRSGSPIHRVQRAEIIIEFFDQHLKPKDADDEGQDKDS